MPQLGESVTEGTVGTWLKQPGEPVAKYESLLHVITDKVDTEVPAPEAGTLLEILVPEGETVRVGTVIARLGQAQQTNLQPPVGSLQTNTESQGVSATHISNGDQSSIVNPPALSLSKGQSPISIPQSSIVNRQSPRAFLSPVVARLVAEHDLDVRQITGSGANGRITKQDVMRYLETRPATGDRRPEPVELRPATGDRRPEPIREAREERQDGTQHAVRSPQSAVRSFDLPEDAELLPLTPMRRAIAEHMEHSVRTAPHVTTVMEVDVSAIAMHRARNKEAFERQGVRLTFTPYFVQAVCAGLQAVPVLNSNFTDEGIVVQRRLHVGVAVALNEGLLVPVIRDADEKNLLGLARAVNDLSERARTRRLKPDETQGGTFTITNHGTSGSLFATPIINQPQVGILGVGAIVKRPVVVSQHGVDAIAIKPMCYLSLTFDHRVADGATADAFLVAVKRALEGYA
ncbi:MAG: 2-oxo acid dehydrogenase subunit E2 [Chloroflexaceae bacterium]|nr:2-oxo acid dehydrogenase subunit E2 [Chloroflexaceae bacterium]